jgi:uncharacterized protein (TIGR02466 family)
MLHVPSPAKDDVKRDTQPVELVDKQLFRLFPTPLFSGKLSDVAVCDRVEKALRDLQRSGQGSASPPSAARLRAYMTPDDLQNLPQMQELVDIIMREAAQILDIHAIKRSSHYISNMWANIAHPNRRHAMHVHPNCLFSGVIYIKTPKNCGPIMFVSPRQLSKNLEPTFVQKNEFNSDVFVIPPEKGRMLMWPSHVPHAVEEGSADDSQDRIVIAFNIMIRGRSEISTAALSFG